MMEYDSSDAFGAGSYPEPSEYAEKDICGTITLTFRLDASVPANWDDDDIINDIKENLDDYIYIKDYDDMELDI